MESEEDLEARPQRDGVLPESSKESDLDTASVKFVSLQKESAMRCEACYQMRHPDEATIGNPSKSEITYPDKIVTWDGDHDPENPKNFSFTRKWMIVCTTCAMTFCITFASSIFASTVTEAGAEFGVTSEVMLLGVALFVMGFAAGPMVWGPISEAYGRKRPLFIGVVIFIILQIPVAIAKNLEIILVCRFLQGTFGAAPVAILAGCFVDFLQDVERGIAVAIFAAVVFAAPAIGPIAGSFITYSSLGWRWTAWITMIISVVFTAAAWVTLPETYAPLLLRRKAKKMRHRTKDWALHAQSEEQELDIRILVVKYLTRPVRMILLEPILLVLTIYTALVYGILYLTFVAYPYSFQIERGWNPTIASLPFVGVFVGITLASIFLAVFTTTWYAKRLAARTTPNPEDRLPPMILGSFLLPIGLFWFAWTSTPSIHWAPQVISGAFIGGGIILIFMPAILYIVDVYLIFANSAIAINTFVRAFFGAAFPMFASNMYEGLHVDWATSLLGFLCVGLIPFPILFWMYGRRIRRWSKFAFDK